MPTYLTILEVAHYLTLSKGTVWRMVQSGQIPAVRFGKTYRIEKRALEQYVQNCTFLAKSE